tara:strand:- start:153 stop:944 length:792 start_codon:yes stop_codon:yes gene_type:complete
MHWALAEGLIDTGDIAFDHKLEDIESLNRRAQSAEYEITALSIHAYAYLSHHYALLNHGASMGEGYGPRIIARDSFSLDELARGKGRRLAVPGRWTSAFLAAQMRIGDFAWEVVPFDQIGNAVERGEFDAGLLIHEGQLTYPEQGLVLLEDLGVWWADDTGGLPLPLGGNAIRRDLGALIPRVSGFLRDSIEYGLEHREEAVAYSLQFGRDLNIAQADEFIGMYVNERTLAYGDDGREAVNLFLRRAATQGLIPESPTIDFVC